MNRGYAADLVHARLAEWAHSRGDAIAIRNGLQTLTFFQLHEAVTRRSSELLRSSAPATLLVDDALPMTQRIVDFLGIITSGRCAAVGDTDWPPRVRQTVLASLPTQAAELPTPRPESPFYMGYTSGSTGTPKAYTRSHQSWTTSFRACLEEFGPHASSCILAPGRDSHSLFLFGMMLGLWSGAGIVVQERFSAAAVLDTLRRGLTPCLVAVPSQLMLMVEVARHRGGAPIEAVRLILISGSRWIRSRTAELRALFPCARIIEFYGASETSFIAWMDTDEATPPAVVGRPFKNVELQIRDIGEGEAAGLIYVRSPMVFTDYVGGAADSTAALRDGDWLSVRDLGYLDAQGRLCLTGRQNRMLVTQGKNLFSEELECVLQTHPSIVSASVQGVDDPLRGFQVVALLELRQHPAHKPPTANDLAAWCRQSLEAYKAPRKFYVCQHWRLTPSGKTDHAALAQSLRRHLDGAASGDLPCLTPLP
ncbi:MAG: AMP-binding protein [Rhodoferax sp.]|uniref:AMP-binding protein n=1 Tax=Rhodoferax sp. TaxID=50421 RepID=UPI0027371EB1|nr:AMP-binding protein [Rhodoferax sp.]MDP2680844.1 AMP-binding protein [Rhodoferax sp.]